MSSFDKVLVGSTVCDGCSSLRAGATAIEATSAIILMFGSSRPGMRWEVQHMWCDKLDSRPLSQVEPVLRGEWAHAALWIIALIFWWWPN